MSNQYFNFSYDPVRQGFDSNTWSTILGVPVISTNKLRLAAAGVIHFADLLRGEIIFNINVAAPIAGDDTRFGLIEYNKNEYLYFKITDDVFTLETSNGIDINSMEIDWDTTWSSVDTEFKIVWEAGMATFYVNNQFKWRISDVTIPSDPMSLYAKNISGNNLYIKYIDVKNVQSANL